MESSGRRCASHLYSRTFIIILVFNRLRVKLLLICLLFSGVFVLCFFSDLEILDPGLLHDLAMTTSIGFISAEVQEFLETG